MKAVAWVVLVVTMLVAGCYTVISLARWQWNRALFFAIVFVAAEVLLAAGVVLARLAKVERELAGAHERGIGRPLGPPDHPERPAAARVAAGRPAHVVRPNERVHHPRGRWRAAALRRCLADRQDRGTRTVDPSHEARLGRQLEAIAYEPGLVVDDVNALARAQPRAHRTGPGHVPSSPRGDRMSRAPVVRALVVVATIAALGVGVHLLREHTQSTHSAPSADSRLRVVVESHRNGAEPTLTMADLTMAHLTMCRPRGLVGPRRGPRPRDPGPVSRWSCPGARFHGSADSSEVAWRTGTSIAT